MEKTAAGETPTPNYLKKNNNGHFGMKVIDISNGDTSKGTLVKKYANQELSRSFFMKKVRRKIKEIKSRELEYNVDLKDMRLLLETLWLFKTDEKLYIITEKVYIDFHFFSLAAEMADLDKKEWDAVKTYFIKFMLRALRCLHALRIIHRRINLAVICMNATGQLKLCMLFQISKF